MFAEYKVYGSDNVGQFCRYEFDSFEEMECELRELSELPGIQRVELLDYGEDE